MGESTGRVSSVRVAFLVSDVRPQVNGIVLKRLFVEGTLVRRGQSLYQIDPAPYIAALRNAELVSVEGTKRGTSE